MRRRNLMDRRAMRIMAARSEAHGMTISRELRAAITAGGELAILLAVGVEIRKGSTLPSAIVSWYRHVEQDPTPEAVAGFARDVANVLVNAEVSDAA